MLYYYNARWYDNEIGRFISADTYKSELEDPQTLNLYVYVKNNPQIYIDPDGHKEVITKYGSHIFTNLDFLEVYPVKTIEKEYYSMTFFHLTKEKAAIGEMIYAKDADGNMLCTIEDLTEYDSNINKKKIIQVAKTSISMLSDFSYVGGVINRVARNGVRGLINSAISGLIPSNKIEELNVVVSTSEIVTSNDDINRKAENFFESFIPFKGSVENCQKLSLYQELNKMQYFRIMEYDEERGIIILK